MIDPIRVDKNRAAPTSEMHLKAFLRRLWVPRWVLDRTWRYLRQDGLDQVESTVLWGGRRFGDEAVVMAVLYPCGPDVVFERGVVQVGPDTTAEMGRWLRGQNLRALCQVHSHPGSWTGHSPIDDAFPIASSEGFLSLVWPRFAAQPARSVGDLGVHRLEGGEWQELSFAEARTAIRVVESESLVRSHRPRGGQSDDSGQLRVDVEPHEGDDGWV